MSTRLTGRAVVAGVDGSDEALAAVRWAAQEAEQRSAPLRLVTVFDWTEEHVVGQAGLGSEYRDVLLEQTRAHLAAAVAEAAAAAPALQIEDELVVGYPVGALVAESRNAGMIVLGDRGLNRMVSVVIGSVTVGVATHAVCPVVVCRGAVQAAPVRGPVVLGVDGTPAGEAAIGFAFDAASRRGAALVAVHTWGDPLNDRRSAPLYEVLAADARELLAQRLAGWNEKYPDVVVERVVTHGRPAQQLLALSEQASLVVVGSRGHGELAGLVLGSVANVLIHRSACPVAVIRPPARA